MAVKLILIITAALLLGVVLTAVFTPYLAVYFVRWLFKKYPYTPPADYARYLENVTIQRGLDYGSAYANGTLDIIIPRNFTGGEAVIFAIHGGAYISDGGDTSFYYAMIATEGFVTVNVNYAIAPEQGKYPIPVKQFEEAYTYIREHNDIYRLNLDKVFFSGDSAGGQIAGQFTAMQTNPDYMALMNTLSPVQFKRVVPAETIRGVVMLCAIYDFLRLEPPPENTMKLPLKKLGQAYFNTSDINSRLIASAGLFDKITENFPRAFITDANSYSFDFEAKEMVSLLESKNIPVTSVFYEAGEVTLNHNYQFHTDTPEGTAVYKKLISFLKE
ncbi:MAG: alpha/beta hydrolase fold domain-containing protein [Spirochaetaceae bacterium]|jgi:acetyl esterase/lipase|nr:alpha/beta hydrolase fold domain-containing protein [Spirochaetaceae bacterium]